MAEIQVDSRGSACPGPITDISKAYRNSKVGDILVVLATDPGIKADAKAWCEHTGNRLLSISEEGGVITVKIEILHR
ncbi:MAG: sulfurtransferase TusA family protein [Candidatus Micrarchaeaceae archaeon]